MKRIDYFDKAINDKCNLGDCDINHTLFLAYRKSLEVNNDTIDFNDIIWEYDIDPIVTDCRKYGIETITISCNFSGLTSTLWELSQRGCTLVGTKIVKAPYKDIITHEFAKIPALIIKL